MSIVVIRPNLNFTQWSWTFFSTFQQLNNDLGSSFNCKKFWFLANRKNHLVISSVTWGMLLTWVKCVFSFMCTKSKGQLVRYINGRYVDLPYQKRHPQNHLNWCKICIKFITLNRVITVSDFTKLLVLLKNMECWRIILNNIEQGVKEEISINFIFSLIETVSWKSTFFLKNGRATTTWNNMTK